LPAEPDAPTPLVIRHFASPADYEACVALQRATWGDDFRELVPPALLQVAQKIGGIAAGAFEGPRLVGFVFGMTGLVASRATHWSHMLAVDEQLRDRGIGQRLKRFQRTELLAAGVTRMLWTFDPLVARNAHLNLRRLGARVLDYARDMYGSNPMSRTDSVIGSDRFVVEWDLTAPGRAGPNARPASRGPTVASVTDTLPDAPTVRVAIPADIQALKRGDPDGALAWRESTRRALEHYLAAGYMVAGFEGAAGAAPAHYVLERTG
jgi:chorismate synthase